MSINNELCRTILKQLDEIYPDADKANCLECRNHCDFPACSKYMEDHGLIEGRWWRPAGRKPSLVSMRITKAGIDYLASDGGVSATLKTITVRFEEETLRIILQKAITHSEAQVEEKSRLTEALKNVPGHLVQEFSVKLFEQLLARTPDVLRLLGKLLG